MPPDHTQILLISLPLSLIDHLYNIDVSATDNQQQQLVIKWSQLLTDRFEPSAQCTFGKNRYPDGIPWPACRMKRDIHIFSEAFRSAMVKPSGNEAMITRLSPPLRRLRLSISPYWGRTVPFTYSLPGSIFSVWVHSSPLRLQRSISLGLIQSLLQLLTVSPRAYDYAEISSSYQALLLKELPRFCRPHEYFHLSDRKNRIEQEQQVGIPCYHFICESSSCIFCRRSSACSRCFPLNSTKERLVTLQRTDNLLLLAPDYLFYCILLNYPPRLFILSRILSFSRYAAKYIKTRLINVLGSYLTVPLKHVTFTTEMSSGLLGKAYTTPFESTFSKVE